MDKYLKLREVSQELFSKIEIEYPIYNIPIESIKLNVYLNFKNNNSKTTLNQKMTKYGTKKLNAIISEKFNNKEIESTYIDLIRILDLKNDPRFIFLVKPTGKGPYCIINIESGFKKILSSTSGVYFFYDIKTLDPLYFGEAKTSFNRLKNYLKITPGKIQISGQGTSVRINSIINEYISSGNQIGIGIIPLKNKYKSEISNVERFLIRKFTSNEPFWNKNDK
jgi:hypothetical protein